MTGTTETELLNRLFTARRDGTTIADLPRELLPPTLEDAYGTANLLSAKLTDLCGPVAGFKIGATNPQGRAFLGVGEPIFGRIHARHIMSGNGVIDHPAPLLEVEPEIILVIADDVPVTEPDVRRLIGRCHMGLEINRPSYADPFALGVNAIVADNAAHHGLVLGPEIPLSALDAPGGVTARLSRDGEPAGGGSSEAVMDHPANALEWLAATLVKHGIALSGGMMVATGAMSRAVTLAPGQSLSADFAPFGTVTVSRRELTNSYGGDQ